ncbi:golgin subfamily A member 4-like isoform X4 [Paramormyrops kingsleyae]|uniref:golgin subfamily A member 4-like isoform X4 n=1 Tax=Paramormyrops kingsleyae TaxID=1676925 RepID=UPI003B96E2D7
MFKKLKQKINEEQSPQRNAQPQQQLQQQAQVGPRDPRARAASLPQDDSPPAPTDRENTSKGAGETTPPRGSVNGDDSTSPQKQESQSLAQKLQLRVSSMESLFRSPGKADGLTRTPSRESLVRSSSRESLTRLESESLGVTPSYDPPSDIESEAEDMPGNSDTLSKEQLLHRLHRVERSLANYRGKYSELVTAYRTVQRDKEKTQVILSQSQDKALRRIGELREELQMDQQAKKHLQEEFDAALEEKDQLITVLQTQVALMKKRMQGIPVEGVSPEGDVAQPEGSQESSSPESSCSNEAGGGNVPVEALQQRIRRQENLLQKCKELLRSQKERSTQLGSENEALQQQLQERLQELEKMKELHTTEKTRLITQLRDAKNLIEQLEQDKGMVIAETKRQMHETLEMKEEEVAQLRARIQQAIAEKEDLQEQREKSERAAFEELERALGVAQRAEESRRQLQAKMEEQMKQVERTSEEERRSLQQELTRVKQEVVQIMKKSSDERVAELEKSHAQVLARKEQELEDRLKQQDIQFQEQLNQVLEKYRTELTQAVQEREQQATLALEEAELQKAAVQSEGDGRVQELQQELEAARTRILELKSSLPKTPQDGADSPVEIATQTEEEKSKLEEEYLAQEAKHQEELVLIREQHLTEVKKLQEQHQVEMEAALKEKEVQFHTHVEDMNLITLEKLDVKQTELEALASELNEVLRSKHLLEEQLVACRAEFNTVKLKFEEEMQKERSRYQGEIDRIQSAHEQSLGGVEKTLKEELNKLKLVVEEKEKALEDQLKKEQNLKEATEKALQEGKDRLDQLAASHQQEMKDLQEHTSSVEEAQRASTLEMEDLRQRLQKVQTEKDSLLEASAHQGEVTGELSSCRSLIKELELQLQNTLNASEQKTEDLLQKHSTDQKVLVQQLEQVKNELCVQEQTFNELLAKQQQEEQHMRKRMGDERAALEKTLENVKKEMEDKLKVQETKTEKIKQKAKDMNEKMKRKIQEQEEKFKKELEKKDRELTEKDKQVKEKILEMSQVNSADISDTVMQLEATHKEQMERLRDALKKEQEDLSQNWQRKMCQQEELREKLQSLLKEKTQEMVEVTQQLVTSRDEKEELLQNIKNLREELAMRETTVQKLQAELKEAATKLESLSESEMMLKEQVETIEKNLNQALTERNYFQDQLSKTEEESREKLQTLSKELAETQSKLQALEVSNKESGDWQKRLEECAFQMQVKEDDFRKQINLMHKQLTLLCGEVQMKMNGTANDLCEQVEGRLGALKDRVIGGQKRVEQCRSTILTRTVRMSTLEEQLQQKSQEIRHLSGSLEQMTSQINVNAEHISALTAENETLQKDLQMLAEKDLCIDQLRKDNLSISETLKGNSLHINSLEGIIHDLKNQLENSVAGKDEAISLLNHEHKEQQQKLLNDMEETIKALNSEKAAALEQAEQYKNKASELKKKVEARFTQNHNMVKSLQAKLEEMEKQIIEKDKQLEKLTAIIDHQSVSKSEMDQTLSEKEQRLSALTAELAGCMSRVSELEEQVALREREQRELEERLQQAQVQAAQSGSQEQQAQEQLQSLALENETTRQELEKQKDDFERVKAEILRSKEEALKAADDRLASESAGKLAELKKKAEQKISQVRKQLTAQVEVKEQILKNVQGQLEEKEQAFKALEKQLEELKKEMEERELCTKSLEEKVQFLEGALSKGKVEAEHQVEQVKNDERRDKESSLHLLKEAYDEKITTLEGEVASQKEALQALQEKEKEKLSIHEEVNCKLMEAVNKLKQAEEEKISFQAEVDRLNVDLAAQIALAEVSTDLQGQVQEKERMIMELESCLKELNNLMDTDSSEHIVALKVEEGQACLAEGPENKGCLQGSLVEECKQKLQGMGMRLRECEALLREHKQRSAAVMAAGPSPDGLCEETRTVQGELHSKPNEADSEKQKLHKDLARLQKDLRSLRKEHEQEVELVKKEVAEDCKKDHKMELEDMEMQHNSRLKQLLREYNTQMAKKEQELESAVREAIGKAQEVEAELIESHREETSQLRKTITQKEEDLTRTVNRYEEILQSREEEMGARVWEIQKELDEFQQRIQNSEQGSPADLQAQLAQKTTLLSEVRLKEQEYQEKIHSLEDRLRCLHKNSVVTHLGTMHRDAGHYSSDAFTEPTEFEYLRKVMFEYMMGRETKVRMSLVPSDRDLSVIRRAVLALHTSLTSAYSHFSPRTAHLTHFSILTFLSSHCTPHSLQHTHISLLALHTSLTSAHSHFSPRTAHLTHFSTLAFLSLHCTPHSLQHTRISHLCVQSVLAAFTLHVSWITLISL